MAVALNQIGQQSLTVSGSPVGLTTPLVTTGELTNPMTGARNRMRARGFMVQVHNQPVRWRADGTNPTGAVEDNLLLPGDVLDLTEPSYDYWGMCRLIKFITDTTATGDATLEIAYFGQ